VKDSQVIIIGGGLAGLTAALHLRENETEVILIEKDKFPNHKVCGEYLSREVIPYLNSLNLDIDTLKAPFINRIEYSSVSGETINCNLKMGGIGLSRYTLDNYLYEKVKNSGCQIINSSAVNVEYHEDRFSVTTSDGSIIISDFVIGAFGKRSNLDKKLKRRFIQKKSEWLAVKAHYKINPDYHPEDLVSLHNFDGGYCGLSKTDLNTINVSYLATYSSFKNYKNTHDYKRDVLMKNPHLKNFFNNAEMEFDKELSIAQICFDKKSLIKNHVLMIGDSAGLIHPLCGNGMAMAIHSAKMISEKIQWFYTNRNITRSDLEKSYIEEWNQVFSARLKTGRLLQKILLNKRLSNISQVLLRKIPGAMPFIIKMTHGKQIHV